MRTDCQFSIADLRTVVKTIALTLPLAVAVSGLPANAQSASHSRSHSDEKWAQQWRKEWLAKHGGATAVVATPKAGKTTPLASASAPAAVNTTPNAPASIKPASAPASSPTATTAVPNPAPSGAPTYAPNVAPSAAAIPAPASAPAPTAAKPVLSAGSKASNAPAALTPNTQHSTPNNDVLAQTRPDTFSPDDPILGGKATGDHTQDSPMASVGDSWKMIVYLVPVLLAVMGCLKLLQRFQARTGRLPSALTATSGKAQGRPNRGGGGIWNALVGGFHLNNARKAAGSSMRLLESMPIGGANVHLLEVRGRVLLLGASPAGLNLLTEFEQSGSVGSGDFRDLLHAAAADMDAMDYEQDDLPATAAVSTLEDLMRETGQSVGNNARRLRTVREVEIDD